LLQIQDVRLHGFIKTRQDVVLDPKLLATFRNNRRDLRVVRLRDRREKVVNNLVIECTKHKRETAPVRVVLSCLDLLKSPVIGDGNRRVWRCRRAVEFQVVCDVAHLKYDGQVIPMHRLGDRKQDQHPQERHKEKRDYQPHRNPEQLSKHKDEYVKCGKVRDSDPPIETTEVRFHVLQSELDGEQPVQKGSVYVLVSVKPKPCLLV